jgi:hypothetical protein
MSLSLNLHKNARTTPEMCREIQALPLSEREPPRKLRRLVGVSHVAIADSVSES